MSGTRRLANRLSKQEPVTGDVDADHHVLIVPVAGGDQQVLEADLQFQPARLDAGQDLVEPA